MNVQAGWLVSGRVLAGALALMCFATQAHAFEDYVLSESFSLPAGSGPVGHLPDGRLVTVVGTAVRLETGPRTRTFTPVGTLAGADFPSFGPAFVRVSPDGTRVAIGNNGGASFTNYRVGVFLLSGLTGSWFAANHFDAAWIDNRHIALTAGQFALPSWVSVLDTASANSESPTNPRVVDGIGGASAGVAFDSAGNLYTGNGFVDAGPSGTGAVKAVLAAQWQAARTGGPVVHFETGAIAIVDVLSASPLQFDGSGNLLVGGGDFASADMNYAAVVRGAAVVSALSGGGPVNPADPTKVRRLDPDTVSGSNFYSVTANRGLGEFYVQDGGSTTVSVYRRTSSVPALSPFGIGLLAVGLLGVGARQASRRRDQASS